MKLVWADWREGVPVMSHGCEKIDIECGDVNILPEPLLIVFRLCWQQAVPKVDAQNFQASGDGAGTATVHAQYDDYLLVLHIQLSSYACKLS